jgi:hypothetical protein
MWDTGRKTSIASPKEIVETFRFQGDFSTKAISLVFFYDLREIIGCLKRTIHVGVRGLSHRFARGHKNISTQDSVETKRIVRRFFGNARSNLREVVGVAVHVSLPSVISLKAGTFRVRTVNRKR